MVKFSARKTLRKRRDGREEDSEDSPAPFALHVDGGCSAARSLPLVSVCIPIPVPESKKHIPNGHAVQSVSGESDTHTDNVRIP